MENKKEHIKNELKKLQALKKRIGKRLTMDRLREQFGTTKISDEQAKNIISTLEEFADIIASQMMRLNQIKIRSDEGKFRNF